MSLSNIISDSYEDTREIKCPIHGYIPVSKFITTIIDTPQFQRLRYLKQLGTSYYVWPGACHNRFEHALGVYHLSSLMVQRLKRSQPDLDITERDVRCVEVAGLLHDLGHGPFSHVWDNSFIPAAIPGSSWKHEDASEMMLDYLVQDNNIDLEPHDVRFIKDLIHGSKRHTVDHDPPEKDFLFEIVANKRNGIDVDKFDYIARDSRAVADGTTTDLKRLVHTARVVDGQICYSEKNSMTVYHLFQDRFNLHKTIYNHKTAKSIEYMIVDALLKADSVMKISERIYDPKKFTFLTDEILLEVERSESPELEESRRIIRRLRNRDLYRMVDKMFLPWELRETWAEHYTPARILETAKRMYTSVEPEIQDLIFNLKEEHIIVDVAILHHGMGQSFPLDNCKFYGKYEPNKAYPPRREADISHLLPNKFGELLIRVYVRDSQYFGVVQHAARSLQECLTIDPSNARRSSTPEVPKTPPQSLSTQLSDVSILSGGGVGGSISDSASAQQDQALRTVPSTPGPARNTTTSTGPFGSVTPSHNNYMTVPIGFTPKTPRFCTTRRQEISGDTLLDGETTPKGKTSASSLLKKKRSVLQLEEGGGEEEEGDEIEIGDGKKNKTLVPNKKMKT